MPLTVWPWTGHLTLNPAVKWEWHHNIEIWALPAIWNTQHGSPPGMCQGYREKYRNFRCQTIRKKGPCKETTGVIRTSAAQGHQTVPASLVQWQDSHDHRQICWPFCRYTQQSLHITGTDLHGEQDLKRLSPDSNFICSWGETYLHYHHKSQENEASLFSY